MGSFEWVIKFDNGVEQKVFPFITLKLFYTGAVLNQKIGQFNQGFHSIQI